MAITITLKGKAGTFRGEDFTPTPSATAEEKAKTAHLLTRFILGGFERAAFSKVLYQRLSNMFGHIAHYDSNGFYQTWFADIQSCANWAEHITGSWLSGIGDPRFTWSDVEKALIQWLKENQIAEQLTALQRLNTEQMELKLLDELQRKYAAQVDEAILVPAERSVQQTVHHQLSLF